MLEYHIEPIQLAGNFTRVYFAKKTADKMLVFVHGFGGHATNTWNHFSTLFKRDPHFDRTDIYFFGYDSKAVQVENSAINFQNFLEKFALGHYDRIVISAHSLGAVVVRRAMLNAYEERKTWINITRMILFAPAHNGSMIPKMFAELFKGFLRIIPLSYSYFHPAMNNLQENSQIINSLINDTNNCLLTGNGDFTIAFSVLWAENEKVVVNRRFCKDPIAEQAENESHQSVCRMNDSYFKPYEKIKNAL